MLSGYTISRETFYMGRTGGREGGRREGRRREGGKEEGGREGRARGKGAVSGRLVAVEGGGGGREREGKAGPWAGRRPRWSGVVWVPRVESQKTRR
jgi:hypothetical protein